MQLKTVNGRKVEANTIACILRGRITGAHGTLVQLKSGEEVLLDNAEEEVVDEMNNDNQILWQPRSLNGWML